MTPRSLAGLALAGTLAVLHLTGCRAATDAGDELDPDAPVASYAASPTTGPAPSSEPVTVPALVGLSTADARSAAAGAGLRLRADYVVGSACLPARQVLTQRPLPGSEMPGRTRVVVTVNGGSGTCGLELPRATPDLEGVAERFERFAREGGSPPADQPVELFIGGNLEKSISTERLDRSRAWQACPGGVGYAGTACPVSALSPFTDYPGPIAFSSASPQHACAHPTRLPERLNAYRRVTLTPDETRDCPAHFGVQLFVNDVSQVVAVNVVLSEP